MTKRFGSLCALESADLIARPGRITGLLGTNGAGKTTALRILMDLVRADAGSALIDGRRYSEHLEPLRAVGFVGEDVRFHPSRSGRDTLRLVAELAAAEPHELDAVLTAVDLQDAADNPVGGYSLGMRQRLALAAALLPDPGALVLDEPMNGLDPQGVRWLRVLLRSQAAGGRTVVISSHLLAEMEQIIDDAVIIDRGRTLSEQPLAELLGDEQSFVAAAEIAALAEALQTAGASVAAGPRSGVFVSGVSPETISRVAIEQEVVLSELTPQRRSLEDAFIALTGSAQT